MNLSNLDLINSVKEIMFERDELYRALISIAEGTWNKDTGKTITAMRFAKDSLRKIATYQSLSNPSK